ncbi:MAG: phage portal protein [Victivallaceae bacterium]|nr:phage portal protein [Victivallaceae bacterium]
MSDDIHFTFGDPEPVQNSRILDALGAFADMGGEYYLPPINLTGLSMMRRANGHHGSCVLLRRNMLVNAFIPTGAISIRDFKAAGTDYVTFGNAYLQLLRNIIGQPTGLRHVSALNMRVKTDRKGFRLLLPGGDYLDFAPHEIIHMKEYDTQQEIYGAPDWIGGLQSALLNQDATLFRRRYYVNGAHLGYILYTNDPKMDPKLVEALKTKVAEGKGVGNFRSLAVHIPNGAEKAFQILQVGDISQKDEFLQIKSISAADVREAHRVPPVLMGIVPQGTSSLGDPLKIEEVYNRTETRALAQAFLDLNDELPAKLHFKFKDFEKADTAGDTSPSR